MTTTRTHPLLAPRTARPGFCYYVYSAADLDEMVAAIWVPAADGADKGAAYVAIKDACGRGEPRGGIADAIRRHTASQKTTIPTATPAAADAPVAPRRKPTTGAWCRRCHGPAADGSGLCHEC